MTTSFYICGQEILEELGSLERLHFLSISLQEIPSTSPENLTWIYRLTRFRFAIGAKPTAFLPPMPFKLPGRSLILLDLDLSPEQLLIFLFYASCLHINGCWNLDKMFANMIKYNWLILPYLQSLSLCALDLELSSSTGTTSQVFPFVLMPHMWRLDLHLRSVSELSDLLRVAFGGLKTLEVTRCPQLDHVFSYSADSRNYTGFKPVSLSSIVPSLRTLTLQDLPKLNKLN